MILLDHCYQGLVWHLSSQAVKFTCLIEMALADSTTPAMHSVTDCSGCDQLYACAECVGGVIAGLMAGPLYGTGASWLKKMLPWIKPTEEPTGDNNELEDQAGGVNANAKELEMQAPLYEAKPGAEDSLSGKSLIGAKREYVLDEGNTIV